MIGIQGGTASVKHPLLMTGGKQDMLGVNVLGRCLDVLHNLEKKPPTRWHRRRTGSLSK
jgi:hypothetical protein